MIGTFPGKLALADGDEVDVDLEIAGGRLRLTTGVSEIGSWPVAVCSVTTLSPGSHELTVDGDVVKFCPDHPEAFLAVVKKLQANPAGDQKDYSLGLALDQVLGGTEGISVPEPDEGSADEIAITLEALFASAYSEYGDDDVQEPAGPEPMVAAVTTPVDDVEPKVYEEVVEIGLPADPYVEPDAPAPIPPNRFGGFAPAGQVSDLHTFEDSGHEVSGRGSEPQRGYVPDTEFDLDAAAARAGFEMPGDEVDQVDRMQRVPARRGIGEMVAKSATLGPAPEVDGVIAEIGVAPPIGGEDDEPTIADQIIVSHEQLRSGSRVVRFTPATVKRWVIIAAALFVVVGFVLSVPVVIRYLADTIEATDEPSTATTLPNLATTVPPATAPPEPIDNPPPAEAVLKPLFELSAAEFVDRWNGTAAIVSQDLIIDAPLQQGLFERGFTVFVGLDGTVSTDDSLESFSVIVDPSGPPRDDQIAIQALGVAINVAEPDASGADLKALLLELGFDVEAPVVDGLDGSASRSGVGYRLVYDAALQLVRLTVSPASSLAESAG